MSECPMICCNAHLLASVDTSLVGGGVVSLYALWSGGTCGSYLVIKRYQCGTHNSSILAVPMVVCLNCYDML